MKQVRAAVFIGLCIAMLSIVTRAETEDRIQDTGFIVQNESGRVFFVRDPKILEPGIEISDARIMKSASLCVLTDRTPPLACPPQNISFRLGKKSGATVLTSLRLEAETAWHRLNRAQKRFAK
jgi:hypothetical protein